MPIKGLSEQRRVPRLGKIHLGRKVPTKSGDSTRPEASDYFVMPPELVHIFGEECNELPIMIPTEDDEVWANQYYKRYSMTRGLVCRGDGITCRRMIDAKTGGVADRNTKEIVWKEGLPCDGMDCPDYKVKACKEVLNLQFIMPDVPGLGVWQIDTSSINSIRNINSGAAMVRLVYKRLAFIPLLLTLEPIEVVNPDDGKKKKVRVLNFRVNGTMRELMALAAKPYTELLLPAPAEDEPPSDNTEEVVIDPKQAAKDINDLWPEDKPTKQTLTPAASAKQASKSSTAPKEAKTTEPVKEPETNLMNLEPKDKTELEKFAFKYFKLQPIQVAPEISMYDLSKLNQRKQAWQQIVAAYHKEG